MDIKKSDVEKVPIWVKFPELDIKYWGKSSPTKIVSIIARMIKLDRATMERDLLGYARVIIEVSVKDTFPDVIEFLDE